MRGGWERRHEICRMKGERMKVQLSRGQERRRGESGNTDMQDKIASVCSCGLPLKEREREGGGRESVYLTYCQISLPFLLI